MTKSFSHLTFRIFLAVILIYFHLMAIFFLKGSIQDQVQESLLGRTLSNSKQYDYVSGTTYENGSMPVITHWNGNATSLRKTQNFASIPKDWIPKVYSKGNWDLAPIVVEKYKLLFFTQGKVACTEFKKLFRRMMHLNDWNLHKEPKIPHDPRYNGLTYLYHYSLADALQMLTDPEWTRAIFVRDPKERVLSAFLDKAAKKHGLYVDRHCCPNDLQNNNSCGKRASISLESFFQVIRTECCCDPHWKPQTWRIDEELWAHINFVGYFNSLAIDSRHMLEGIGNSAWTKYGASGWGVAGNESIFMESSTAKHRTSASKKISRYFNHSSIVEKIEDFYADDYKRFNFIR